MDELQTQDEQQRTDGGEAQEPKTGDYTGPMGTQDLPLDTVAALTSICKKMDAREKQARLQQVARCQKARFFERGQQYLTRKRDDEAYSVNPVTTPLWKSGGADSEPPKATFNIYLRDEKVFISTFSQTPCGVRFEPNDPMIPRQVEAAKEADAMGRIVCKINSQKDIQADVAAIAWTDGLVVFYSRNVTDGSKFGVDETGKARNYPEIEVGGALEWKVPIAAGDYDEWDYVRNQREISLTQAKESNPAKADKLTASSAPLGGDLDLSRQARISTKEGITSSGSYQGQSGDAAAASVTRSRYWLRPSAFHEADDKAQQQFLKQRFPQGCFVEFIGEVYVVSRDEDVADHIVAMKTGKGGGWNRPGLGDIAIDPQEAFNNCGNIAKDCFENTIPHSYFDKSLMPPEVINDQRNQYGYKHPIERDNSGVALSDSFYTETPINPPAQLAQYAENLQGPLMQSLTGQQPSLYGGKMGSDDRVGVYSQAREMAMGLMGLVWVPFKTAWAQVMRQCVKIASDAYGEGTVLATMIDGENGKREIVKVNIDNMKGDFLTYPNTDESFPETWSAKKAQYQNLVMAAKDNPELGALLLHPDNLRMAKNLIGLDELVIPGADSAEKQMQEIEDMEKEPPIPDPKAVQDAQQAAEQGMQIPPAVLATIPQVSSVDIQKRDDDAAELATCVRWLNSATGQKAFRENRPWYDNVSLHADQHEARIQSKQNNPQQKPPSQSMNFKDMPPAGKVQMAAEAGIQLNPQDVAPPMPTPGTPLAQ